MRKSPPPSEPLQDPEAWARLSRRARWLLEHPDQISPLEAIEGLKLTLRLWMYRGWGTHLSWGLFVPLRGEKRPLVRELRWNAAADRRRSSSDLMRLKRRATEEPTLRIRDAFIDKAKLAPYLHEAPKTLSSWLAKPVGDAAAHSVSGIEGYRSLTHVRLEWASGGPAEGREVVAWVTRLRRLLDTALRDRERV